LQVIKGNVSNIKPRNLLFLIFLAALILRLGYVIYLPQVPITTDAIDYDNLASQIADGKGFSHPDGSLTAHRPPLYPFTLAFFYYSFGHNYLIIRIFQAIIGAFCCILIYVITKQLIDHKIALRASVLSVLHPALIFYSGLILTETISGFLVLTALYFLVTALRKDALIFYILFGIFLGLLVLCRQEMLLLVVIFPLLLALAYRYKKKIGLYSLIAAIAAVLVIFPWTMRNHFRFKSVVPVATGTGSTFWKDSHPARFLEWDNLSEYEPVKSLVKDLDLNKAESHIFLDKALFKEGLRNVSQHPFIYMRLCAEHLGRFLIGSYSSAFYMTRDSFAGVISKKEFGVLAVKILLLIISLFLLALAGVGMFVSRAKLKTLLPVLLPIFYVAGIHTIFFGEVRYQVPIMPLILIFSAAGINILNPARIISQFMKFYECELKGSKKYHVIKSIAKSWEPALMLSNKRIYNRKMNLPFKFIGFMLSRECQANCIFCPVPYKKDLSGKERFMPMRVVKKVVDELAGHEFSGSINFGENGDALLNPDFKNIIEYTRERLPLAKLVLYTNMMNVDRDVSEFLIKHNLSKLTLNIDGASEETYRHSKPGLNFNKVKVNLHDFISARNKAGSSCQVCIEILSPKRYMNLRKNKKINAPYDSPQVIQYWKDFLSAYDCIDEIIWFYSWNNQAKEKRRISCPSGILGEAFFDKMFISTEGDVYICCLDYNTRLTYGNVLKNSIYDLWKSEKRRQIMDDIINKRFKKIGQPCLYCSEKFDYLACYLDFIKHRYF